jgi:hypothetical protein
MDYLARAMLGLLNGSFSFRPAPGVAIALFLSGCGGSVTVPNHDTFGIGTSSVALTTADITQGGPCSVSVDGFVWYALQNGIVPPIDFEHVNCKAPATISSSAVPAPPNWSRPSAPTQALFVATSLQEAYSLQGMQQIAGLAQSAKIPVTWMIGNPTYITNNSAYYNELHTEYGDDVQLEESASLYDLARQQFSWYVPAVSVEGAGRERNIAGGIGLGNGGFWGITWNSHGTDNTSDEGAPWGTYCADVTSYKRPSPNGNCDLVAFEWTARDLTRSYLANTNAQGYSAEAAFSTDPDDVLQRGGFDPESGAAYERAMVDAYAAAGVSQPLVMMSQQESMDEATYSATDDVVLGAIYQEAVKVGMKTVTLSEALGLAKSFSAKPRAIAFPFIPGGMETSYNGVPFTPATIDFHDDAAGMTFISGHTLPSRLYEYAQDPVSIFTQTLVETLPSSPTYPVLTGVTAAAGSLVFSFQAPQAMHFGIALWSDPATLGLTGSNATPAGHAGAVVTFDLPAGKSTQIVPCAECKSTTLPYSL